MLIGGVNQAEFLVVGGGPAGAAAALLLAREGREVVLLEARTEGQGKVCGEFVSAEGVAVLRRLGVLDRLLSAGAVPISRVRIHAASGQAFDSSLPSADDCIGLGASRCLLDETLLSAACASGVSVLRGARLTELSSTGGHGWVARAGRRGTVLTLRGRWLLGADGRNSRVAELSGLGGRFSAAGVGLQLHTRRPSAPPDCVELRLFAGGYAGLAAIEGNRWCLGALLDPREARRDPFRLLLDLLLPEPHGGEISEPHGQMLDHSAAYPVRMGTRRATSAGLILVGDAAGTVDPYSGQGIALALLGSEAAAEAALGCSKGLEGAAYRSYASFLRKEVGARLAVTALLRPLVGRQALAGRLVGSLSRHPGLGRRLVGLTRRSGGFPLNAACLLAARIASR